MAEKEKDIVERLRDYYDPGDDSYTDHELLEEAADKIERLRDEIRMLRDWKPSTAALGTQATPAGQERGAAQIRWCKTCGESFIYSGDYIEEFCPHHRQPNA